MYTKAEIDILLAAIRTSAVSSPALVVEAGGTYPLRSTATGSAAQAVIWKGPDAPPATAGYALNGDVWWQTS